MKLVAEIEQERNIVDYIEKLSNRYLDHMKKNDYTIEQYLELAQEIGIKVISSVIGPEFWKVLYDNINKDMPTKKSEE